LISTLFRRTTHLRLSRIVPLLLAAACVTDAALRFAPFDWFTFRAWEAMTHFQRWPEPFEANKRYDQKRTYGDLAAMGNLPRYREYRSETFTTDALGLRNPPGLLKYGPASAILVGDSFAAGSGSNDNQTLASQLWVATGRAVYNSAPIRLDPTGLVELAHRLKMPEGVVIYQHLSRDTPPPDGKGIAALWEPPPMTWRQRLDAAATMPRSPMQILADRAVRRLQNGWIRPNPYADNVAVMTLRNGDWMLFRPPEVQAVRDTLKQLPEWAERSIDGSVGIYKWYADTLRPQKLRFVVALVPDKFTVYRPLLAGEPAEPHPSLYLEVLEQRLREAGVEVMNLSEPFIEEAAARLEAHQYLYWRDDTHWNPAGIRSATRLIAPALVTTGLPSKLSDRQP
jgi:hypothetical protein